MKKKLIQIISISFLLLIWQISSIVVDAPLILPSPKSVAEAIIKMCTEYLFWCNLLSTVIRCFAAFFISMITGFFLGVLCGLFPFFYDFLEFPLAIVRTTPVVAFILIALFWFNSNVTPVIISVVMALPIVITSIYSGFNQIDKKLLDMAKVFDFTFWQVLIKIKLPALSENIKNAVVSSFGLTWKVVAAGEVLCLPKSAIGTILQRSQVHLETSEVLGVTIIFVAISFILEKVLKKLLQLFR